MKNCGSELSTRLEEIAVDGLFAQKLMTPWAAEMAQPHYREEMLKLPIGTRAIVADRVDQLKICANYMTFPPLNFIDKKYW